MASEILTDAHRDARAMLATHHTLAPWTWVNVRRAAAKHSCRALARLALAEVSESPFRARITASGVLIHAGMQLPTKGGA